LLANRYLVERKAMTAASTPTKWGLRRGVAFVLLLVNCTAGDEVSTRRASVQLANGEVDCTPVHQALARIRSAEDQSEADQMAIKMRSVVPHGDIPTSDLVKYFAPQDGDGRPANPSDAADLDLVAKWILCDALTREIVTRHYLADHPELR